MNKKRLFLSILMSLCAVSIAQANIANVPSLLTLCSTPAELLAVRGVFKNYCNMFLKILKNSSSSNTTYTEMLKEKHEILKKFEQELSDWQKRPNLTDAQRFSYTDVMQRRIQQITREISVMEFMIPQMSLISQFEENSYHFLSQESSFHSLPRSLKQDLLESVKEAFMVASEVTDEIDEHNDPLVFGEIPKDEKVKSFESQAIPEEKNEFRQKNSQYFFSKVLAGITGMGIVIAALFKYINSKNHIVAQSESPEAFDISSFVSNGITVELLSACQKVNPDNGLIQPTVGVRNPVYTYVAATAATAVVSCLIYLYWSGFFKKESSDVNNQDKDILQDDIELALRDKK